MSIAPTPEPPYYAAIFSSVRNEGDEDDYNAMGERMVMLAMQQPGFIGFEVGDDTPERFGLFISYWKTAEAIVAWKKVAEHEEAQRLGRETFYAAYKIRIAKVERDYGKA